ncbi:hypothetical protein ACSBR2_015332 [Camellia fascicularis]
MTLEMAISLVLLSHGKPVERHIINALPTWQSYKAVQRSYWTNWRCIPSLSGGVHTIIVSQKKRLDAMLLDLDKKQNSKKDVDTCRKVLMSVGVGHKSETDTTWTCAFLEVSVLLSLKYLVICSKILTLQPRIQSLQTG